MLTSLSKRSRLSLAIVSTALMLGFILWPEAWLPLAENKPKLLPHTDKVVHFVLFAGCAILWMAAVGRRMALAVLCGGVVLAVGTEWLQGLPAIQRDGDPLDALGDVLGAIAAVWIFLVLTDPRHEPNTVLKQTPEPAEAGA